MAKEKVVAVVVAKVVPDQVPVALEVARGMSAEIFCKGSAKGTIAVTGTHLLATTSKRAVAKGTIASSFMALLRVILPVSLLPEVAAEAGLRKRNLRPRKMGKMALQESPKRTRRARKKRKVLSAKPYPSPLSRSLKRLACNL